MNTVKVTLLNAIDMYFKHLSNFGSMKNSNKEALLITLFIQQILDGPMSYFITSEDYSIMENLLYCLNGTSCLIEYNKYCQGKSIFKYMDDDTNPAKILEVDDIRITGDGSVRFHIL